MTRTFVTADFSGSCLRSMVLLLQVWSIFCCHEFWSSEEKDVMRQVTSKFEDNTSSEVRRASMPYGRAWLPFIRKGTNSILRTAVWESACGKTVSWDLPETTSPAAQDQHPLAAFIIALAVLIHPSPWWQHRLWVHLFDTDLQYTQSVEQNAGDSHCALEQIPYSQNMVM